MYSSKILNLRTIPKDVKIKRLKKILNHSIKCFTVDRTQYLLNNLFTLNFVYSPSIIMYIRLSLYSITN